MIDFKELSLETIQSQYATSPNIREIIRRFVHHIDPNPDIELFYKEIFNLDTARGIGLDIWGAIVDIPRFILINPGSFFGLFGSLLYPFNQEPFFNTGDTEFYKLEDEPYRRLIYYKAMANISDSTIPSLNNLLRFLYEDNSVYVLEIGAMQIRVVFERLINPYEYSIFNNYALLAKGAGVGVELYQIPVDDTFGFAGSRKQSFNQGTFDVFGPQGL